ncbi:MAG TPA: hypothetical protein VGK99_16535 [Acidobacteriota bacterium]|jgi:hypothetical protein
MENRESIFSINEFLELELWLKSVPILFRYKRFPFTKRDAADGQDFRAELELALEMVRRIEELCEKLKADPGNPSNGAVVAEGESDGEKKEDSNVDTLADSIKQIRTVLTGMLAKVAVDLRLFKSVGNLLRREFESFRGTPYFTALNYSYFETRVAPVISSNVLIRTRSIPLRVEVSELFLYFVRLMAYLRFMNSRLRGVYRPKHFFLIFTLIHFEAQVLLRRLKAFAGVMMNKDPRIGESFQIATSALKIENRRVFEQELKLIDQSEREDNVRVRLEDSSGLLWNCYQNCFITLAKCFNPDFNRYEVFDNIFERYEQSVRLLNDLKKLAQKVGAASQDRDFEGFVATLRSFAKTTMQYLMYKDQLEVQNFLELLSNCGSEDDRHHNLHRFAVYLDALIAEVSKRGELGIFYQDERGVLLQ